MAQGPGGARNVRAETGDVSGDLRRGSRGEGRTFANGIPRNLFTVAEGKALVVPWMTPEAIVAVGAFLHSRGVARPQPRRPAASQKEGCIGMLRCTGRARTFQRFGTRGREEQKQIAPQIHRRPPYIPKLEAYTSVEA